MSVSPEDFDLVLSAILETDGVHLMSTNQLHQTVAEKLEGLTVLSDEEYHDLRDKAARNSKSNPKKKSDYSAQIGGGASITSNHNESDGWMSPIANDNMEEDD